MKKRYIPLLGISLLLLSSCSLIKNTIYGRTIKFASVGSEFDTATVSLGGKKQSLRQFVNEQFENIKWENVAECEDYSTCDNAIESITNKVVEDITDVYKDYVFDFETENNKCTVFNGNETKEYFVSQNEDGYYYNLNSGKDRKYVLSTSSFKNGRSDKIMIKQTKDVLYGTSIAPIGTSIRLEFNNPVDSVYSYVDVNFTAYFKNF